jgi:hypothetical protein
MLTMPLVISQSPNLLISCNPFSCLNAIDLLASTIALTAEKAKVVGQRCRLSDLRQLVCQQPDAFIRQPLFPVPAQEGYAGRHQPGQDLLPVGA